MNDIKNLLNSELSKRDNSLEISYDKPDPLLIAKRYNNEYVALICALFAYGKASLIVKFLDSLDFDLLNQDEKTIKESLKNHYYRFQNSDDVAAIFIALKRLKLTSSLEDIFKSGYNKESNVLDGIKSLIESIKNIYPYQSKGYTFLVGNENIKESGSPLKRWNMYLRWMVRDGNLDLGLWSDISRSDLIIPLDTHTFNISNQLGLINRKTYNLKSAILLTDKLKEFDRDDPIKYDFAIYRIGQENLLNQEKKE